MFEQSSGRRSGPRRYVDIYFRCTERMMWFLEFYAIFIVQWTDRLSTLLLKPPFVTQNDIGNIGLIIDRKSVHEAG